MYRSYQKQMEAGKAKNHLLDVHPCFFMHLQKDISFGDLLVRFRVVDSISDYYKLLKTFTLKVYNPRTFSLEPIKTLDDDIFIKRRVCGKNTTRRIGLMHFQLGEQDYLIYVRNLDRGDPNSVIEKSR